MKVSKELENYILDIIEMVKAVSPVDGENSAGFSNSILMATRAYVMFLGVEQQFAMNFTDPGTKPKMEVVDGGGEPDPKN